MERPLISFVVLAYNQESFIREAIEGALTQTYSPLEIVFSDDCSDGHAQVFLRFDCVPENFSLVENLVSSLGFTRDYD